MKISPADYPRWLRIVVVITLSLLVINLFFFLGPLSKASTAIGALRDWQILIAATIAFAAAGIAYKAAMAKVRLDREIADREVLRKKLSLYLKLEFALEQLAIQAGTVEIFTRWKLVSGEQTVSLEQMQIAEPGEITEAWNYLDVFPMKTIQEMRIIRTSLRKSANALAEYPAGTRWKRQPD
jgi:hypothetical protein